MLFFKYLWTSQYLSLLLQNTMFILMTGSIKESLNYTIAHTCWVDSKYMWWIVWSISLYLLRVEICQAAHCSFHVYSKLHHHPCIAVALTLKLSYQPSWFILCWLLILFCFVSENLVFWVLKFCNGVSRIRICINISSANKDILISSFPVSISLTLSLLLWL